jgi:hypothetical protein
MEMIMSDYSSSQQKTHSGEWVGFEKHDKPQSHAILPIPVGPESATKRAGGERHRKRQV